MKLQRPARYPFWTAPSSRACPRPHRDHTRRPDDRSYAVSRTAFVSTYAPRPCGIAAFTYDLATTVGEREIVAINPPGEPGPYPAEVRHRIRRDTQSDYPYVAQTLNDCGVDAVSVQFQPKIWGGEDGAYVLDFIRELRVASVVTLHSVRPEPTPAQRMIVNELVETAATSVVMSQVAMGLMESAYGISRSRIELIPHGVPALPLIDSNSVKPKLGLQGKTVVLSLGPLAPGKGFEAAIDAMPAIAAAVPSLRYVILGITSPDLPEGEGAKYRAALEARVAAGKMGEYVKFVDGFMGRVELSTWLEAADVILATNRDLGQTVSSTLAYAVGAGRAAVSPPTLYATELLADGRGLLVPQETPKALAAAIIGLLLDDETRTSMGTKAHALARSMVWWEVGSRYREAFERAARISLARRLPPRRAVVAFAGRR